MMESQSGKRTDEKSGSPSAEKADNADAPEREQDPRAAVFSEGEAGGGQGRDQLERELADANARALRAQAELENFRKRARRELEEETRYAALPLMRDILQVVDNLQLAIQAAEQHQDSAGLLEGVQMVSRQLTDVLRRHDCVEIEADGQPFDPHLHEAILFEPSEQHPAGENTRVARGGYRLHERVVRPAQVCVSRGKPDADNSAASGS
jgi:molecular chaperone GrpE